MSMRTQCTYCGQTFCEGQEQPQDMELPEGAIVVDFARSVPICCSRCRPIHEGKQKLDNLVNALVEDRQRLDLGLGKKQEEDLREKHNLSDSEIHYVVAEFYDTMAQCLAQYAQEFDNIADLSRMLMQDLKS